MITIIPINSFVQPYTAPADNCAEQIKQCLPVFDPGDIAFMFTSDFYLSASESHTYSVALFKKGLLVGTPKAMTKVVFNLDINEAKDYVYINDISSMGFDTDIDEGECFSLRISTEISPVIVNGFPVHTVVLFQTVCFQKITDACWTSVIKYRCNENSFGLFYAIDNGAGNLIPNFYNKIRLPFYLTAPQFPISRNVFVKSNGERKKLSSRVASEYECETDYMAKDIHEKLIIAMEHDQVFITNIDSGLSVQAVSQEGDYAIDWQRFLDYPTAPAKFKLFKTPYNNVNSNC